MAIGILGGSARGTAYVDYDITISAKTGEVSNWTLSTPNGQTCYTQTILTSDISPNLYIDGNTDFQLIPRMETITQWGLEQFGWLSAAESTAEGIKVYSMTGQPSFDIPVTLRVMM